MAANRDRRALIRHVFVTAAILVALVLRLPFGMPNAMPTDLMAVATICHAEPTQSPQPDPAPNHDCALCPVCLTALDPALFAAHAAVAQAPTAWRAADDHAPPPAPDLARRTARHPARAPPIAV